MKAIAALATAILFALALGLAPGAFADECRTAPAPGNADEP